MHWVVLDFESELLHAVCSTLVMLELKEMHMLQQAAHWDMRSTTFSIHLHLFLSMTGVYCKQLRKAGTT